MHVCTIYNYVVKFHFIFYMFSNEIIIRKVFFYEV